MSESVSGHSVPTASESMCGSQLDDIVQNRTDKQSEKTLCLNQRRVHVIVLNEQNPYSTHSSLLVKDPVFGNESHGLQGLMQRPSTFEATLDCSAWLSRNAPVNIANTMGQQKNKN